MKSFDSSVPLRDRLLEVSRDSSGEEWAGQAE